MHQVLPHEPTVATSRPADRSSSVSPLARESPVVDGTRVDAQHERGGDDHGAPGRHNAASVCAARQGSATCSSTCSQITTSNATDVVRSEEVEVRVVHAGEALPRKAGSSFAADLERVAAGWIELPEVLLDLSVHHYAYPVVAVAWMAQGPNLSADLYRHRSANDRPGAIHRAHPARSLGSGMRPVPGRAASSAAHTFVPIVLRMITASGQWLTSAVVRYIGVAVERGVDDVVGLEQLPASYRRLAPSSSRTDGPVSSPKRSPPSSGNLSRQR